MCIYMYVFYSSWNNIISLLIYMTYKEMLL